MDSMDSMPFSSEVSLPHKSLKCKWKQNNWPNEGKNVGKKGGSDRGRKGDFKKEKNEKRKCGSFT